MRRSPGAARFAAAHRSAFLLHGEKSTATPMLRPAMPIATVLLVVLASSKEEEVLAATGESR